MRVALCLLFALSCSLSAAEDKAPKPVVDKHGQVTALPWCRVTVNMASTIDRDEPALKALDGWYDPDTYLLISQADIKDGAFGPSPLDPARVVSVVEGKQRPELPEKAAAIANRVRAEKAKPAK